MTIFDLLFLVSAVAAIVTLLTAAVVGIRGRGDRARSILKRLGVAVAAYIGLVLIEGAAAPQKILSVGDPWCFDDWCLSVDGVTKMPTPVGASYTISLRVFSDAKRVSQRAKGAWIYLIDPRGTRYGPLPDADETPLDVLLQPGESVKISRSFMVPNGVHGLGLITGHGGPYCSLFPLIIGQGGCIFNKPTMVRIE